MFRTQKNASLDLIYGCRKRIFKQWWGQDTAGLWVCVCKTSLTPKLATHATPLLIDKIWCRQLFTYELHSITVCPVGKPLHIKLTK